MTTRRDLPGATEGATADAAFGMVRPAGGTSDGETRPEDPVYPFRRD